jgi:BASS family bile acid:Na+ symporter
MNLASLIPLVLKTSIALMVLGLGLRATLRDATHLFRQPGLLLRSLLSMNVIFPLLVVGLVAVSDLHQAVRIALIALSISPVPPVLPNKQLKAGAKSNYAFGLLVTAALMAIVFIPVTLVIFGKAFGNPLSMSPGGIAMLVLTTVLAPLALGVTIRELVPSLAKRIAKPIALISTVLLILGFLPILFTAMPAIASLIGNGTVLAIIAFVVFGLAVGHLLGGPESKDRTALALATASRHPGVAIAMAQANFPEQKLAAAAVLLYLIVSAIVTIPYLKWTQRHNAAVAPVAVQPDAVA